MKDDRLAAIVDRTTHRLDGLLRLVEEATTEELEHVPAGVRNSLAWIVRHSGEVCWLARGVLGNVPAPVRPAEPGLPPSWRALVTWDEQADDPAVTGPALVDYVRTSWEALQDALATEVKDMSHLVETPHGKQTGWWLLELCTSDINYHTGQANYLLRMMAATRGEVAQVQSVAASL